MDKETKIRNTLRQDTKGDTSYEEGIRKVATAPANVRTRAEHQKHAAMRFIAMAAMEKRMKLKAPRQNRFVRYTRLELQAAKKVALQLLAGRAGSVLVVWGDEGFCRSGPGYAWRRTSASRNSCPRTFPS